MSYMPYIYIYAGLVANPCDSAAFINSKRKIIVKGKFMIMYKIIFTYVLGLGFRDNVCSFGKSCLFSQLQNLGHPRSVNLLLPSSTSAQLQDPSPAVLE